ncbi:MAG: hypothetical protein JO267_13560 [Alphaproteobacteria bacterium]|nr:hypothetical protein [Alphaproteobacteria bacterium]MBV9863162.1 hypothetical protein [Alphaproteobacteria bacterium]
MAKYATAGFSFGTTGLVWVISNRAWGQLPAPVQDALTKAGPVAEQNFCTYADSNEDAERGVLEKGGMTVIDLAPAERSALQQKLAPVADEWATDLDRRGKPATPVLHQLRDIIAGDKEK